MQDLLLDLKEFLIANGVTDYIFRDTMGDTPDTAIALYEYQGVSPGAQVSGAVRPIQIVTRSKSISEAKKIGIQIYKLLQTEDSIINLTTERWAVIHTHQTPWKLKVDDKKRTYYVFNNTLTTYVE